MNRVRLIFAILFLSLFIIICISAFGVRFGKYYMRENYSTVYMNESNFLGTCKIWYDFPFGAIRNEQFYDKEGNLVGTCSERVSGPGEGRRGHCDFNMTIQMSDCIQDDPLFCFSC